MLQETYSDLIEFLDYHQHANYNYSELTVNSLF